MESDMKRFKTGESRNQMVLFPQSLDDYLPDNHLSKLILSIISNMDLNLLNSRYSKIGQRAYSPQMLLSLLIYGYSIGIRSSRKLSKACEERVDFMYLSEKLTPSYKTISEFRREHIKDLTRVFEETILIAKNLGILKFGDIKLSIDGTKIRANASSKLTKDIDGFEKLLKEVRNEIQGILKEAEVWDKVEDKEFGSNRGDELPNELNQLSKRETKIKEAIENLKLEQTKLKKK